MIQVLPDEIAELLNDATPAEDAATDETVKAFLAEHTTGTRPEILNGLKNALLRKIEGGASRHDSTLPALTGAMKEARAGYYPAQLAADTLGPIFVNAAQLQPKARKEKKAEAEFDSMLAWAVSQALAADLDEVRKRVEEKMPAGTTNFEAPQGSQAEPPPRRHVERTAVEQAAVLAEAHAVFRKWFGDSYDLDALDVTLATLAVERLGGDPLWLLLITGSGNAKTETVCAAADVDGAHIMSSIASEGALLSATSKRERTGEANGALLRKIGERGTLVVKDVTTILSMDRTARGQVLSALREIYDGLWVRNVGTDGGREIPWRGRIAFLGAVTSAWDTHHTVVAAMGDRFVLLRTSSREGRRQAGRQALRNIGSEKDMRTEMAAVVAEVTAGVPDGAPGVELTEEENERLLAAADLVTLSRTAVDRDYQSNPTMAHEPEMPTRFAKQLAQVLRGAVAVGLSREAALRLALRCARDSMPPIRLAIIDYLAEHAQDPALGYTPDVRQGVNLPRNTVDRELQAMHMLRVLDCDEVECVYGNDIRYRWRYSLAEDIDPTALVVPESVPDLLVGRHTPQVGGAF